MQDYSQNYYVYKLDDPDQQVGMPAAYKWAVGGDKEGYITCFTKFKTAKQYAEELNNKEKQ